MGESIYNQFKYLRFTSSTDLKQEYKDIRTQADLNKNLYPNAWSLVTVLLHHYMER